MIKLERLGKSLDNNKCNLQKVTFQGQNNLELYLNDVYDKECVFKIKGEDVAFIQTGIETVVKEYVDILAEQEYIQYPANIIKVGSFYEQTKNDFPDEFDFIFTYQCIEGNYFNWNYPYHIFDGTIILLDKTIREKLNFKTYTQVGDLQTLSLDLPNVHKKGPATCWPFIYRKHPDIVRTIHVDLVPAIKVQDSSLSQNVSKLCELQPFRFEILSMGSYLLVLKQDLLFSKPRMQFSFTETEVYFMRNVLSENHRKVYRILKYLINGHGDGEKLAVHFRQSEKKHYSSYKIKTMMIYHHYKCTNSDAGSLGPCILQVLGEVCEYDKNNFFPVIARSLGHRDFRVDYQLSVKDHLEVMTVFLQSMMLQTDGYDYEKYKIRKSVSKRYADDYGIV